MKSTYKLIGVEWDRRPIPDSFPFFMEMPENVQKMGEEYNLFDLKRYERYIDLSKIWALASDHDLNLLDTALDCDRIYLKIDKIPQTVVPVTLIFYAKRLLQTIKFMQVYYGEQRIAAAWSGQTVFQKEEVMKACSAYYANTSIQADM